MKLKSSLEKRIENFFLESRGDNFATISMKFSFLLYIDKYDESFAPVRYFDLNSRHEGKRERERKELFNSQLIAHALFLCISSLSSWELLSEFSSFLPPLRSFRNEERGGSER